MTLRVASHVDVRYTTRLPTGVDKHIARMVRGLAARPGFDVSVVAPRNQLVGGDLPQASSLHGLPVDPIPFSNRFGRLLWAVSDVPPIDRFCPGVDWVWSPQELWAPARHARTAVTVHGSTYFEPSFPGYHSATARFERARMAWFFRRICRCADLVLPVSHYLERFLIDAFGLRPERSMVVGNGVDEAFFSSGDAAIAAGPGVRYDADRVLVVGGLNGWDGADRVLASADALAERIPGLEIDVVGTMDDPRSLAACQRRPTIRRLGFRPPAELAAMMPHYLALLYLPNVESFGIVALEAMAAALPVLACRLTAVPETAGDGAWYVDENRPEEVVEAVVTLRADPVLRRAWVERGRRRSAGFTWEACLERLARAFGTDAAAGMSVESLSP
ncbi:MAG: glycosyltransferase family 4 protein [Planctomycetia bacterium]